MAVREAVRPGGRSARVQQAVHAAVNTLAAEGGEPSVPAIATLAGVTPSTIYRRWGDLKGLLADVAVERLRPDSAPADTGSLTGDLAAWLEQYAEEMSSEPGRAMIRDVLASSQQERNAGRCCAYTSAQLALLFDRAAGRGEPVPSIEGAIDRLVAPVMYRILFSGEPVSPEYRRSLLCSLLPPA